MTTVTKRVPLEELPANWRRDFTGSALVEVRLSSVFEESDQPSIQDIAEGIQPVKPSAGYRGSVEAVRQMRDERLRRITNPNA